MSGYFSQIAHFQDFRWSIMAAELRKEQKNIEKL